MGGNTTRCVCVMLGWGVLCARSVNSFIASAGKQCGQSHVAGGATLCVHDPHSCRGVHKLTVVWGCNRGGGVGYGGPMPHVLRPGQVRDTGTNVLDLGHANCPPPYPQAGLHGAILYPPPKKTGYEFCT